MKIAIVGAGYAGLALTWYLLQKKIDVTLFDGGEGASHVSTGLLHLSPGKKGLPTWRGEEGMEASLRLLTLASRERAVFEHTGILRQKGAGGEFQMEEGATVYSKLYLQELKKMCEQAGAHRINHWVEEIQELDPFDRIVLTAGASLSQFVCIPVKKTLGQSLLCRWKKRLPQSLLADVHITPTEDPELCLVGSTYEHTEKPDPKKALELLERAARFYPPAKEFQIEAVYTGIRVAPPVGYRPIILQVNEKTWVFTGLGSRGLIYHALLAQNFFNDL